MHVQILVDDTGVNTYTNLDFISGVIVLRLSSTTSISSIVVKLEGESRTRLRPSPNISGSGQDSREDRSSERETVRDELHKVLYRLQVVFPDLPTMDNVPDKSRHYTLNPGQYEYPFKFKFPFNNTCYDSASSVNSPLSQVPGLRFKKFAGPTEHLKTTLPPTLTGFPGVAEIRYYLKVTVNRKEFYKENMRVLQYINFLPIEPPERPKQGAETFARRQHQFLPSSGAAGKVRKGFMGSLRKGPSGGDSFAQELPVVSAEARIPTPSIVTCNEDLPMRIMVKRVNNSIEPLFLQSLHIQLDGNTHIRAHDISCVMASNWVIFSRSNMSIPLRGIKGTGIGQQDEELFLDPDFWTNNPLPNTIAPTFRTCNITRKYALEIQIGIGYGDPQAKNTVIIPLHHPVQVYSGITPPPALLDALSSRKPVPSQKPLRQPTASSLSGKSPSVNAPPHLRNSSLPSDSAIPPTSQPGPSHAQQQPQFGPLPPGEEEPPPSYEDAIAVDLPPVDGPRRNYEPPPVPDGADGFGGKGRRNS